MEITGVYTKTIFRNESDGFTIFKFRLNRPILNCPVTEITCKGTMQSALICTPMKLKGDLTSDDFGDTFVITHAEAFSDSEQTTIEYLSSNLFEGIAETTAKKIVEITGPDIFSFVQENDAAIKLQSIRGFNENRIANLIKIICHTKTQKEIFEFLSVYGAGFKYAEALFQEYGARALETLKENPYKIGNSIDLPFRICDCIAKENGVKFDDTERIEALIINVIRRCYTSGDMYILLERLFNGVNYVSSSCSAFPGQKISYGLVVAALSEMKQIITEFGTDEAVDEIRFYLKKPYFDEKTVADNVARIQKSSAKNSINVANAVSDAESHLNITYSEKQAACFNFLSSTGIKIITGGPGTGKTTVVNGLIHEYKTLYPDSVIKIMAPTGRAAQRISEVTNLPAGTIHRMLNILPYASGEVDSSYNADFPADLLIIDEASMLDTSLTGILLKSLKSGITLIFCGDIDQLPSVGAGNVLHELITSGEIDVVQLDTNYRQKNKSTIIENAIKVNTGLTSLAADDSFKIIECDSEEEIQKIVVKTFVDTYNTKHPYDIQVLSSTKKGAAGIFALNKQIQLMINSGKSVSAHSNSKLKVGDKIMTTHNNYEYRYFNGDMGIIKSADENFIYIDFFKEEIAIPKSLSQDIELAYACTVHKSQGSEYGTTIIALPAEPNIMLKRNLLYTAITRAKGKILIVAQKGTISKSVKTAVDNKRKSALSEKIIKAQRRNKLW